MSKKPCPYCGSNKFRIHNVIQSDKIMSSRKYCTECDELVELKARNDYHGHLRKRKLPEKISEE